MLWGSQQKGAKDFVSFLFAVNEMASHITHNQLQFVRLYSLVLESYKERWMFSLQIKVGRQDPHQSAWIGFSVQIPNSSLLVGSGGLQVVIHVVESLPTHVEHLNQAPSSQLQHCPVPPVASIWEFKQQMATVCLSLPI